MKKDWIMLTEKDYCDYETSRELKELGFVAGLGEGDCGYCLYDDAWHDQINRPLLYEVQKWLREEKNIEANASFDKMEDGWIAFIQRLDYPDMCGTDVFSTIYNTYESALLVSIKEAIEILKKENND